MHLKWGNTPIFCSGTKSSRQKYSTLPDYAGSPTPSKCRALWPTKPIKESVHNVTPPRRNFQSSWCHPPPDPTGRRTFPVSSALYGGSWKKRASLCHKWTASGRYILMYPPYLGSVNFARPTQRGWLTHQTPTVSTPGWWRQLACYPRGKGETSLPQHKQILQGQPCSPSPAQTSGGQ